MGKKRPAQMSAAPAFPNGTAFRKSASKKRKGDALSQPKLIENAEKVSCADRSASNGKQRSIEKEPTTKARYEMNTSKSEQAKKSARDVKVIEGGIAGAESRAKRSNGVNKIQAPNVNGDLMIKTNGSQGKINSSFRIVAGSYERLLYGLQVTFKDEMTSTPSFETIFSFAAHTSCITAVATAGADSKWLATGAGDETVRVWDLRKRKEVGGLIGHGGTIHSLSFPTRTYLLSTDSSGLINLYRTRDWALLKTLRGHTGKVNACVAHPSGKVALSVGKDGMLRMWDLMRGKGAGAVRLNLGQEEGTKLTFKEEPLDVKWNQSGSRLAVMGRTEVVVYKTDMTRIAGILVKKDDSKRKFGCIEWEGDDILLTGNEMGIVELYQINDSAIHGPIGKLVGHTNRIRTIRTIPMQIKETKTSLAVTASSDGKIRLFDITSCMKAVTSDEVLELQAIGSHDTGGARLTCLDVVGGDSGQSNHPVEEALEDEGEDENSDAEMSLQRELGQDEIDELNDLLDVIEEAKSQGVHIEGMSEFEHSDDDDEDEEDEDNDESYGGSDEVGLQEDGNLDSEEEEEDEEELVEEDEQEEE